MIGLTLDPMALIEIRRHRLKLIAQGTETGRIRSDRTDYIDVEAVKAELLWARRLCNRRGWPVIDVTRRSIEETAATVLQLMEAWHERRRKAGHAAGRARDVIQADDPRLILASQSDARAAVLPPPGCGSRRGRRGSTRRP